VAGVAVPDQDPDPDPDHDQDQDLVRAQGGWAPAVVDGPGGPVPGVQQREVVGGGHVHGRAWRRGRDTEPFRRVIDQPQRLPRVPGPLTRPTPGRTHPTGVGPARPTTEAWRSSMSPYPTSVPTPAPARSAPDLHRQRIDPGVPARQRPFAGSQQPEQLLRPRRPTHSTTTTRCPTPTRHPGRVTPRRNK
jgi:hypothetical protein